MFGASKPERNTMRKKITREFAAACTDQQLHCLLHSLFNQLADRHLDAAGRHCCHASVQVVRSALAVLPPR